MQQVLLFYLFLCSLSILPYILKKLRTLLTILDGIIDGGLMLRYLRNMNTLKEKG